MTEEELAGTAGASTTAAGVDDLLLWEATARADALLADLTPGRTTKNGLVALLSYLREVVLARITEEDRYALPALSGRGSAGVAAERLRLEHLALREDIEALAEAAAARGPVEQDALADLTRQLIERLERHLRHEAATLEAAPEGSDRSPGWVTAQRWFPLTEGPDIDMDALPADHADDAILNRLMHLRREERVELHGHHDPAELWRRLQRRAPGAYSWSVGGDPQQGWRVSAARREV